MAQFRATIKGQRGSASRLGSKNSGISARVNVWDVGVRVDGSSNGHGDEFSVFLTGGSHAAISEREVGRITIHPKRGPVFKAVRS